MAAFTIGSDFGGRENKNLFILPPFAVYLPWSDETRCHDLSFWMLRFKPAFLLCSFTFIKRLFRSSSVSAIKVVTSSYLRLFIFLLAILIPVCDSFIPVFHVMCSAYNLNNQSDNILPCCTFLPILSQSFPFQPCPFLDGLDLLTGLSLDR